MKDRPVREKLTSKLAYASLGWLTALMAAERFGTSYTVIIAAAATVVSAAVFALGRKYSRYYLLICTSALAAAVYIGGYDAMCVKGQQSLSGSCVTVTGTVTALERTGSDRLSVSVRGKTSDGMRIKAALYCEDSGISCGDRVTAVFDAAVPQNTSRFEREDYLRSKGIYLTCTGNAEVTPDGGYSPVLHYTAKLRAKTEGKILAQCGQRAGGFIVSVLCGDKSYISPADKSALFRGGLGHIFVVSGTHVILLCAFILTLIKPLIHPKRLRSLLMIAVLCAFAVFSGFSVPVVRACIMSGLGFTAVFFRRRSAAANSLGLAAILITLSCPYAVGSASFMLSFAASYAFGVLSPALCRERISSPAARTLISNICITLVTLPLTAYYFSELPLLAVLANLLLIPLCSVCLGMAFLFMLSGGILYPVIRLAGHIAGLLMRICGLLTASPVSYAGTYHTHALMLIGAAAVIAAVYTAYRRPRRTSDAGAFAGIFAAAEISAALLSSVSPPDCVTVFPDKRGCTAVVWTDGSAMIFDLGDKAGRRYDAVRLCESLHADETRLFLTASPYSTASKYRAMTDDITAVYSPEELPDLTLMPDRLDVGGVSVFYTDGQYTVTFGGHRIELSAEEITADGECYLTERFEETSEIVL